MKHIFSICWMLLTLPIASFAQPGTQDGDDDLQSMTIDGEVVKVLITETDTIIVADLEGIEVNTIQKFESKEEHRYYNKIRRSALKVYPLGVEAIRVYRKMEEETAGLSKRKRKKYIRKHRKKLGKRFTKPLKNLSKTEGKVLVEMIERELQVPMHTIIKDLRGGFNAGYWNTLGKMYGYRLNLFFTSQFD